MTPVPIAFGQLKPLFGLAQDDPRVTAVLARAGKVTWTKPSGGERYAVAKQAGFDILVSRPRAGKRTAPMIVHTIFLYREGASKHAQFADPPYGLTFGTRAEILRAMPPPERTWKIGKGEVPVSTRDVSHDRWTFDDLFVSADYDEMGAVAMILVSLRTR